MKTTNKKNKRYTSKVIYIILLFLVVYSLLITYLFINKRSVSSSFYRDQEKEIEDTYSSEENTVSIVNQIDNFAYGGEHAIPVGGGAWCVYKKENNNWSRLFCSQDEKWCGLYKKFDLPKWLIGDCKQEEDPKFLEGVDGSF